MKAINWILAALDLMAVLFLCNFTLGSREDAIEIYNSMKGLLWIEKAGCYILITAVISSILIMLVSWQGRDGKERGKILRLNFVVIVVEVLLVLLLKFSTHGYI